MTEHNLSSEWKVTQKPANITRSFHFDSYDALRKFLDDLADLSERVGYYPSLNFTRTQVNISIEPDTDQLGQREYSFAEQTDALIS